MCMHCNSKQFPGNYRERYSSWTPNCLSCPVPGPQKGTILRNNYALQMPATHLQALPLMPYCPKHLRITKYKPHTRFGPTSRNPMATAAQERILHPNQPRRVKCASNTQSRSTRPAPFLHTTPRATHGSSINTSSRTRVSVIVPSYSLGLTTLLIHPGRS
ncbi:unnamed protein product [Rhizoctonia solani]|uniref:Uncharacterized protein n=1 Tax=Rhizoctonia solani TaxID=456999 RepID=A0A8H3B8A3_9AGAM|nr:unnamed protein product [Rhizoctonia solani]